MVFWLPAESWFIYTRKKVIRVVQLQTERRFVAGTEMRVGIYLFSPLNQVFRAYHSCLTTVTGSGSPEFTVLFF